MALIKLNSRAIPDDTVIASDIADGSISTAKLAADAVTNAKLAADAVTTTKIADTVNRGRRNLIINGAMQVAQRATSAAGLGNGGDYYTLDRHRFSSGNTAGRLTQSQASITDLPGFANAMKLDCTTADTSIAANEDCSLQYRLEGQDLQQLKKGTSSAESVTVSFYMKTNKAFTFMCELDDTDNNRFNGQQFTTSTSWTRHTLTFVGDTTGTLDDDNARSMMLNFWIHAGSNFTGGTYTANTWQSRAVTDTNRAVGIGSFYDDTANELHLTGLQMEVGDTATPFEHRPFNDVWEECQRYCTVYNVGGGNVHANNHIGNHAPCPGSGGHIDVGNRCEWFLSYPVKRSNPTITVTDPTHMRWLGPSNAVRDGTGAVTYPVGTGIQRANIFQGVAGDFPTSVSPSYWGHSNSSTYPKITIDSEL